jgi:hypothetical protein
MSPTTIMAAATGSDSASGTAMAGGLAASGFAADRSSLLQTRSPPGKPRVFRGHCCQLPEKDRFFSRSAEARLLSIDGSALLIETVV